jgi:hypothetical protein
MQWRHLAAKVKPLLTPACRAVSCRAFSRQPLEARSSERLEALKYFHLLPWAKHEVWVRNTVRSGSELVKPMSDPKQHSPVHTITHQPAVCILSDDGSWFLLRNASLCYVRTVSWL